ncbi:hypothetical protein AAG906_019419 [Vitis piasezkii]
MDEMQNDMNQKFDNIQYSIARLINLNTVQEKENSPSQPHQNSMSIHEVEAQEGESLMVKEVETVITLRSGKEVDLPTCKLEHKVESETEKEKREEIKGKKKGKSTEKDDYDFDIDEEPQRIVIKEEMMKHMPPPFLQALEDFTIAKPFLAHECHFADDSHFAAAKWSQITKREKSQCHTAPHFGNCWTHFDHFPKFKLCMQYLVGNLGKSGDHTHQASHSISNLLKPSNPIATGESSSWETMPSKETTEQRSKS